MVEPLSQHVMAPVKVDDRLRQRLFDRCALQPWNSVLPRPRLFDDQGARGREATAPEPHEGPRSYRKKFG